MNEIVVCLKIICIFELEYLWCQRQTNRSQEQPSYNAALNHTP